MDPFPVELVPLAIVRLFSSSAATSLALDIYKEYGTDSQIGLIASIMMSSTETVFYTMSVYFSDSQSIKDPLDAWREHFCQLLQASLPGVVLARMG